MFYKINGSAGRGKTTLLVDNIANLYDDTRPEYNQSFVLLTPTNKAAMVLNSKLAEHNIPPLAKTIHSSLYTWIKTSDIRAVKKVRDIDPTTAKFKVDSNGNPVYREEIEYYYNKELKDSIRDKIVFIDESSMVQAEVWYDLLNCDLITSVYAYGDEKQLPPIEDYEKLSVEHKPYYRFWHNYTDQVETLQVNYRQQGTLKDFVETIETSLFAGKYGADIPSDYYVGDNFSIHAKKIVEQDLISVLEDADIIITPYNKVRQLVNIILRRLAAVKANREFDTLPVVGDRIILVDAIKRSRGKYKEVYLPKNVTARITAIHDISLHDNLITLDFTDEQGVDHLNEILSLNTICGVKHSDDYPRFDYAYAVTAHSSQGGQWDRVVFLNGHWPGEDANKLRYVAITRARKELNIINGITNSSENKDAEKSIIIRTANILKNLQ